MTLGGRGAGLLSEPRGRAGSRARRTRRRRFAAMGARILAGAALFFVGLSVGRALDARPEPGRTQTLVRTLEARTLPPLTRTVTVTGTMP